MSVRDTHISISVPSQTSGGKEIMFSAWETTLELPDEAVGELAELITAFTRERGWVDEEGNAVPRG